MVDPFRLRVMKALSAQIKTVTVANGYTHDLSDYIDEAGRTAERVFRGRDIFSGGELLPFVSILEDFRSQDTLQPASGHAGSAGKWKILVQGFVKDDFDHPTDPAYHLCADVIAAIVQAKMDRKNILGQGNRMPCVTALEIGQPVVRPADGQISDAAFFFLPVTLTVVEDLENPFA